jgi:hypothetical protein
LCVQIAQQRRTGHQGNPFRQWCRKVAYDLELANAAYRAAWGDRHMLIVWLDCANDSHFAPGGFGHDGSETLPPLGGGESVKDLLAELDYWLEQTKEASDAGSSLARQTTLATSAARSAQMHLEAHHLLLTRRLAETRTATHNVRNEVLSHWSMVETVFEENPPCGLGSVGGRSARSGVITSPTTGRNIQFQSRAYV